jgi:hypothetical protein
MKILRCKLCRGEVDIISGELAINKKIKCRNCEYSNEPDPIKQTEVIVIRKKSQ